MLRDKFMTRPLISAWAIAVGLLVSLGTIGIAHGQTDDERSGARSAAAAGIEAYNAGRYADAFDLLTRAESLVHAPPHLLYMARSAAKLGHLVQAREIYIKIGQEQLVAAAPRPFIEAQQSATQEQRALEGRLAYLTVKIEGGASDTKVAIDSRIIPSVLIGVPIPVDPGPHELVATAVNGDRSDVSKLTLAEGQRDRITLTIRPSSVPVPATATAAPASTPATTQASTTPSAPPAPTTTSGRKAPVLAWVSLGVGAVGAGLGTVFLIQYSSKKSDANAAFNTCNANVCTPAERENVSSLDKSSASAGTLSLVSYGIAGAALTTGLYLMFSSGGSSEPKKDSARFTPYVGPRFVGASVNF